MWTQKHHHCSISLTSRRLILTPQLFPGVLTHWHSIHPLWSHTDTNTEPFCKLHKGNHSCSEPADSTSLTHTHSRGAPQDQAGDFQTDPAPFSGTKKERPGVQHSSPRFSTSLNSSTPDSHGASQPCPAQILLESVFREHH